MATFDTLLQGRLASYCPRDYIRHGQPSACTSIDQLYIRRIRPSSTARLGLVVRRTGFSDRPRTDTRTSSSYYLCNRARTTLRVEAQRCSGQAVRGLPPAAPVQELQPGTPVTTSPERPFWPFWPLTARWRLREQSTGKLPCKGFEHSEFKASRRCTRRGLPTAAPAAGGYSVPRRHSTAPRSDRPRTELRREGLRHPFAKTVKLFRRGHEAPRALTGATRAPRQVTSGDADADRDRPRGPVRVVKGRDM